MLFLEKLHALKIEAKATSWELEGPSESDEALRGRTDVPAWKSGPGPGHTPLLCNRA